MSNPIPTFDAKDVMVIFLLAHVATDAVLVGVFATLWFAAHIGWWR